MTNETEGHNLPHQFLIFAQVYIVIVMVLGVSGNLLTIYTIYSLKNMHTLSNFLISHLCATDLLYMVTILPIRFATFYFQEWIWSEIGCSAFAALSHFFYGISIYTLVLISLHRLLGVVHQGCSTNTNSKLCVALQFGMIYAATFFVSVILPLGKIFGHYEFTESILSCTFSAKKQPDYKYLLFSFGVWFPFVVIIICYVRIFVHVRASHKNIEAPTISQRNRRQAIRLSLTMLCSFCVFLMCTLPYFVVNVSTNLSLNPEAYLASLCVSWLSSCMNPIVYVAVNPHFRQAYKKVCLRYWKNGK
ncbi:hypothetical protein CAPTEDRAFT_107858 [Capitella teleta]|uniref:G-protein coupled receptors family 1 profile domain-containing protein n=1 Tax=Capitella teleta TaxID=283909 RepID=R7UKC2_CAPTE|nr:hypothetical protein CAPTEDRAFT_107858 [Capitella teleta]|eukprot:ELU03727.1 hypothetical protein CAPTEDRAFT_107858 [Capitella teleta]